MAEMTNGARAKRGILVAAAALGLTVGAYGVASAASGSSGSTGAATARQGTTAQPPQGLQPPGHGAQGSGTTQQAPPQGGQHDPQHPWGGQRSDETPLTGDALGRVTSAAKEKLPGATIVRVETDAEGNAAYEAHVVTSSGNPATVYVGKDYAVTSVEQR